MRHIHLIDTAVASDNLGDEIIISEARAHIDALFPDAYITTSSGHDGMGHYGRKHAAAADQIFLLGTNALIAKFQLRGNFIWSVSRRDIPAMAGKVVLFGVGANSDYDRVNWRQKALLRKLLSATHQHAVRDETGRRLLQDCGLQAINTSCPTLWRYQDGPPQIRSGQADRVCFTLTKHKPDAADLAMIDILRRSYKEVWFWPQQPRDLTYLQDLTALDDIRIVAPNLAAYDRLLASGPVDVVGTRLHGGIRGLLHGQRVVIIAIDNRARDIGRETGLPTVMRSDIPTELADRLANGFSYSLSVPPAPIRQFLDQFRAP